MAEIKMEKDLRLIYECPECEAKIELGQSYCRDCKGPLEWKENYE